MLDTFIRLKSQHMCSIALVIKLSWPDYRAANQRAYPKLATPSQPKENEEAKKRTTATAAAAAAATKKKSRKIKETETKTRRQNERQADQAIKNSQIH